jgi:acetyl esterase/lipase
MRVIFAAFNFVLMLLPGLWAARVAARRARGATGLSFLLAWVPALPLLIFGVMVGAMQAVDPTAANLWPLSMALLALLTVVMFAVVGRVRQWLALVLLVAFLSAISSAHAQRQAGAPRSAPLMTAGDLDALPSHAPDQRIAYGADSSQYGELRVPAGRGPHPVVILVHGGCFKAAYATSRYFGAMADTLKSEGVATWNVEYRRLGQPGGGWPGTYLDIGKAVDHLRTIAPKYNLDLNHVVIVGHSAGGHLAMWAAARPRVPAASPLHVADPLRVRGVVDLAGPVDMTANIAGYQALCRDTVITSLLGGTPATVPERYAQASAINLLPLGIPQVLVMGTHEDFVPLPLAKTYLRAAARAGDSVRLVVIAGAGHFEIASPRTTSWPRVESSIHALLDGRLPQ